MKLRLRILFLILILIGLWASWLSRSFWVPLLLIQFDFIASHSPLLEGLSSLIDIGGFILNLTITIHTILFLDHHRKQEQNSSQEINVLQPVTLAKLYGSNLTHNVSWIDRNTTHPDQIVTYRRLVIVGRMKIGKTREALELIRRIIAHDLLSEERLYTLSPAFPFLSAEAIREGLRRKLTTSIPLLLFIDDLTFHYTGSSLELLSTTLSGLDSVKIPYILATARLDQMTEEVNSWLKHHHFHIITLPDLSIKQTRHLIANAVAFYQFKIDKGAQAVFVANRDGTPELTLISFRRLKATNIDHISKSIAQTIVQKSIAQAWAAARADILKRHPSARYLLQSLAAFHADNIHVDEQLILKYAAYLWQLQNDISPPWHRLRILLLRRALSYLTNFNIISQEDQIRYPDFVAENESLLSLPNSVQPVSEFIRHPNLLQVPLLNRFYTYKPISQMILDRNLNERAYSYIADRYGIGYESLNISLTIDPDGSGLVQRSVELVAFTTIRELDTFLLIPYNKQNPSPITLETDSLNHRLTISNASSKPENLALMIEISPPLVEKDRIKYHLVEELPAGLYAIGLTQKQRENRISNYDYFAWNINRPTKRLSLSVTFPENLAPENFEPIVRYTTTSSGLSYERVQKESKKWASELKLNIVEGKPWTIKLDVEYPQLGLTYGMVWPHQLS